MDIPNDLYVAGLSDAGQEVILKHYGMPYRSGRFPYGSGEKWAKMTRSQRRGKILEDISKDPMMFYALRKNKADLGMTDAEIREWAGMSTTEYRSNVTLANAAFKQFLAKTVQSEMKRGAKIEDLAKGFEVSPETIRNYMKSDYSTLNRNKKNEEIKDILKMKVEDIEFLDVGLGVETQLGISKEKMRSLLGELESTGEYEVKTIRVKYATNDDAAQTVQVLVKKGTETSTLYDNLDKIRGVDSVVGSGYSGNLQNLQVPKSVDWNRVAIKYAIPEGERGHGGDNDGQMMDGVMVLRPGVKDLDMGGKRYAQVRIAVGDTHYLKGMAIYGEAKDFPKGVDIIFNTNKKKDVPKEEVLKELKEPLTGSDPFGAVIKRQAFMLDSKGQPIVNKKLTDDINKKFEKIGKKLGNPIYENGAINIVNEEGDWGNWQKTLSSQFLSKQPEKLVREQLGKTIKQYQKEYAEIQKITNPVIKKKLMQNFADNLESQQIHLKAVAPKGFQGHVILPVTNMKVNEVYAPNYPDGSRVILVRYPHAGRFEIPELIVNNRGAGRKVVGARSTDAIGIHPKVAQKLSGADFDGDTVYVIPNNSGKFKTQSTLKELRKFDPNEYKDPKGTFKVMPKSRVQAEMGTVSNLITDMTLRGASDAELARAVKHSMVVIDAHKHKLNYKRSEQENGIEALKKRYQYDRDNIDYTKLERIDPITGKTERVIANERGDIRLATQKAGKMGGGANTIISRRKHKVITKGNVVTDAIDYKTGKTITVIRNKQTSYITNMLKDASVYLTDKSSPVEHAYVDYVNELKSFRSDVLNDIGSIQMPKANSKAKLAYAEEIKSLSDKHTQVLLNKPKERQAQMLARKRINDEVKRLGGRGEITKEDYKKLKQKAINGARDQVGASRQVIKITDMEWDAIQAGAISPTRLLMLTSSMDDDQLKQLAMPRSQTKVNSTMRSRVQSMLDNGYTLSDTAAALGISVSTVRRLNNEE